MPTESLAELVRFAPDAYGFRWANHVALFIVTDAGVLLVDANGQVNPRTPSLIKEAIRSVTTQPVKYFVYSHSAFDHSTGGAVFADTARFVGHKNTVDRIKAANDPTTPAPDLVFDKKTTLELGGRVVDLYPADLSPTDDYIVVHYPAGWRCSSISCSRATSRSARFSVIPSASSSVYSGSRTSWTSTSSCPGTRRLR